jgi:putative PIN family toxin of toxin-antitoxin system
LPKGLLLRGIGLVTDRLRAVLDTNVFVSAFLSRNPTSPTKELIHRWEEEEFTLLVSDALLEEIAEKLKESKH